jgi:hypothetical protein
MDPLAEECGETRRGGKERTTMRSKLAVRAAIGTLVLAFGLSALALGAKKEDPDAAGELYGDLYVIERDGNGEPVLREVTYPDSETGNDVTVKCVQPMAEDCGLLPLWGECGSESLDPGVLPLPECTFDPEAYDPCAVYSGVVPYDYANLVQEVSFGRGSVARAQDFVIDSAYSEVIKTINDALEIEFDPAGRIRLGLPAEDSEDLTWKTIDAPLENLGLYRETMTNGCLGTVTDDVIGEEGVPIEVTYALDESAIDLLCGGTFDGVCAGSSTAPLLCEYPDWGSDDWWMTPTTPDAAGVTFEDMLLATAFLGGATDKGDPLGLDEVINVNTYLGLNTYTWEKQKKDRILTVTYFDFGEFTYDRSEVFPVGTTWDLLSYDPLGPCYASGPVDVFGGPDPGVDLDAVNLTVCRIGLPLDAPCDGAFVEPECGGADFFAQAAEHARKTIWFIHNWEVPEIAY